MKSTKKSKIEDFISRVEKQKPINTDFSVGLKEYQVEIRRKQGFVNKVPPKVTKTTWNIIKDNVFTFFNLMFLIIGLSLLIANAPVKFYLFAIPVLANISIGLISDIRARSLVQKLRLVNNPKARVVRNGRERDIPVEDLVLSDVMVVFAGDQICADATILSGSLSVDQSMLTGESIKIKKKVGSTILSGTYATSGKAYCRVDKVGIANYAERLQDSAKSFSRPKSELKSSSLKIFKITGIIAVCFGLAETLSWLIGLGFKPTYQDYRTFVMGTLSGSLEAMIPAGLYLLTSIALETGVINLAKKRMNVQELYSLEMLARSDVICFDKTGTLTDGNLGLHAFKNYSKLSDEELATRVKSLVVATGDNNSTALCIRKSFEQHPYPATQSIPFNSDNKYSAATLPKKGTYVIGAPGFVPAGKLTAAEREIKTYTNRGFRVLGVYYNKLPIRNGKLQGKCTMIGLLILEDHIKEDAPETIKWFVDNRVTVKVISGDNPITVSEIAKSVGVPDGDKYINMYKVKDEEIPEIVDKYAVFGRVKPNQKELIVAALQAKGHTVAMTGDGVNDILALKKADCSIAMASGSSAAQTVSHLVSLDSDFSKLPFVVAEGRRVINNLQRSSALFLTKTAFAIFVTLGSLIISWSNQMPYTYPFNPTNMYIWELVTIGLGGLLLSLQPSRERLKGSYLGNVLLRAIPAALTGCLAVSTFLVYGFVQSLQVSDYESKMQAIHLALSLSVLGFTAISYVSLFRISLPLDGYRTAVFVVLVVAGLGLLTLDYIMTKKYPDGIFANLFGIDYEQSQRNWLFFGMVTIAYAGGYFLFDWGANKYIKHSLEMLGRAEGR